MAVARVVLVAWVVVFAPNVEVGNPPVLLAASVTAAPALMYPCYWLSFTIEPVGMPGTLSLGPDTGEGAPAGRIHALGTVLVVVGALSTWSEVLSLTRH